MTEEKIRIIVYGTLKRGFGNNSIYLTDDQFCGSATFKGKMYDYGYFPYVDITEEGIIHGEVFEVTPEELKRLDHLEGYPGFYDRTKIKPLDYKYECWVYHISGKQNDPKKEIISGKWERDHD